MANDETIKINADTSQAVAEVAKLENAVAELGSEMPAAFDKASAAADKFLTAVETGGKGATRSLALATVQIDALEKELLQLKAAGKPTAALEAGIEALRAKLAVGTAQLGKFRAAAADAADATRKATQRAGEFSGSVTDVTGTLKTLSPALGNAIDKYSILAAKAFVAVKALQLGTEALSEVTKATGNYNGATADAVDSASKFASSLASFDFAGAIKAAGTFIGTMDTLTQATDKSTVALGNLADAADAKNFAGILKVQQSLVQGHEAETAALNVKAAALEREIQVQTAAGEVQGFLRDAIKETLEAYAKIHEEVPAGLAAQAAALGIVTSEQEKTAASSAKLEETSVKSADARAKAETAAADAIVAALERERQALDAKLAQDEARLAAELAKGSKLDTSGESDEARAQLNDLKQSIKDVENQPLISVDQLNSLNEMKDRAGRLTTAVNAMSKVFTVTRDDFLDDEQAARAAAAAWDVYGDMLDQAQNRHNAAMDSIDGTSGALDDLSGTADDASDSLTDVADAAGKIGDEAKDGADTAKDAMKSLTDGANEALPILKEIKVVLQEIVALGAQADI